MSIIAIQYTSIVGWEDPLEEDMATHSSNLSYRILWTEERGGLWFTGPQRVEHDWVTEHTHTHIHTHIYIHVTYCNQILRICVQNSIPCPWNSLHSWLLSSFSPSFPPVFVLLLSLLTVYPHVPSLSVFLFLMALSLSSQLYIALPCIFLWTALSLLSSTICSPELKILC